MECMVTACVEGEPVRWRIRQQQQEFCYLVQNGKIGPHHDGLYCAQMAQTSIVVLRRCLPLRRSRDPQLMKGRWSVDWGIDYFKGDAAVNVSVVAQNFLMVKIAGRSFGRKKYGLTVTVSSTWWRGQDGRYGMISHKWLVKRCIVRQRILRKVSQEIAQN
jgi:hypothetical protein